MIRTSKSPDSGPTTADPTPAGVPRADQLAYLADLIAELRELARRTQCETLTGLLDVAHREALLQRTTKGHR